MRIILERRVGRWPCVCVGGLTSDTLTGVSLSGQRSLGGSSTSGDLSPVAQLLALAINPAGGGLFAVDEHRFNQALVAVHGSRGAAASARRARREALDELVRAGVVERSGFTRRPRLVPRSGVGKPLARLRRCIAEDDFADPRDVELFLLLAWTGLLTCRLEREERRVAVRRLRKLVDSDDFGDWIGTLEAREKTTAAPSARSVEIPEWARALGTVALREEIDLVAELVADVAGGGGGGSHDTSGHGGFDSHLHSGGI